MAHNACTDRSAHHKILPYAQAALTRTPNLAQVMRIFESHSHSTSEALWRILSSGIILAVPTAVPERATLFASFTSITLFCLGFLILCH